MAYHGSPIDLAAHTRLSLMAAAIMGGADSYSAESAVLEAVRLDTEVKAYLKREATESPAIKFTDDLGSPYMQKRGFLG